MNVIAKTATSMGLLAASTLSPVYAAVKHDVTFDSAGQQLQGDLYLPDNHQVGEPLPAVIVSGSWTSVKEQMAGGYAARLAEQGYAALVFDFRGWGTSAEGAPMHLKYVEHPLEKTQDIIAAATFLSQYEDIDASRIATLGICASAGYAIDAAQQSEQISGVAVVAPWLHDEAIVNEVYGEAVPALLSATEQAKTTGKPTWLEAASSTNEQSVMYQADYYTDPQRGAIDAYDNTFSTLSWEPWLTYDAIQTAAQLTTPVLLVHSDAAAIPQGAKKFAQQAGDKAHMVMLDNVSQFDFYDSPTAMTEAISLVDAHFKRAL